ncbi:uncharacterized protein N7518_008604 [Penicillium psychrosexuale]|uniref:uncharacterized protein n=1 Tax=Penicillium psychrosexuale TaxID=1002107 RepID=UPI00254564F1|nr:uncharacterized protein N7518_008604 [Penicillium psychrosexuale]KAJ5791593.1 hypothetical protein N7518_008604 [Penicillium psychrosexuale]
MSAKRPRLASPVRYNRLPIPETDIDTSFPRYQTLSPRLVLRTDSQVWGLPESAEIRAIHTLETTPENEQLVRTHHPALRLRDLVYVSHPQYGPEVWLVNGACEDIEAGGRPLHPYPEDRRNLYPSGILTPRSPWKEDYLFREGINPRKFLSPEKIDGLRELFPTAVGARVFVSGFLVVLFKSLHDIQAIYEENWIMEAGGLRILYDEYRLEATADTVTSGMEVCDKPESLQGQGCLGLRIRMNDGKEAITTVTHGFVRNPRRSRMTKMFSEWILRAKSALLRLRNPPPQSDTSAIGVVRNSNKNSPIGKEVWLATEKKRIGTISYTFDDPSPVLPFPAGYRHDLSLIMDDELPQLISPPGYPAVSEWASYSTVLAGSDVYVVRMNTVVGRWALLEGTVDPNAIRNATVIGTQYLWDRTAHSQTASLLWKTKEPFSPADGWSGSVLCLGRPTDESSQAVVFQNFEVLCTTFVELEPGRTQDVLVKGGFLLPESIRSSQIVISNDEHRGRNSDTYPRRRTERAVLDRRVFSAL